MLSTYSVHRSYHPVLSFDLFCQLFVSHVTVSFDRRGQVPTFIRNLGVSAADCGHLPHLSACSSKGGELHEEAEKDRRYKQKGQHQEEKRLEEERLNLCSYYYGLRVDFRATTECSVRSYIKA